MKEQQALHTTYADLLDNQTDLALLQLVQELDSICSTPRAPTSVNWSAIKTMHATQKTRKRAILLPFRTPTRPAYGFFRRAVLVPVLVGLVLATAAFSIALSPLLRAVLSLEPSSQGLLDSGSFVNIHQSQTIDGVTVTLEDGYADANQIILGYTISYSNEEHIAFRGVDLRTRDGIELSRSIGMEIAMSARDRNTSASSMFFNTGAIKGNPRELDLSLSILIDKLIIGTSTSKPAFKKLGTIHFSFTLPFHPGRVATPELKAASHGKTVTLERVVVSRSATRIVVQGIGSLDPTCGCGFAGMLQVPGDSHHYDYGMASPGADGPSAWSFVYPYDFSKNHGTWTLTIKTGIYTWVFHFVVPA